MIPDNNTPPTMEELLARAKARRELNGKSPSSRKAIAEQNLEAARTLLHDAYHELHEITSTAPFFHFLSAKSFKEHLSCLDTLLDNFIACEIALLKVMSQVDSADQLQAGITPADIYNNNGRAPLPDGVYQETESPSDIFLKFVHDKRRPATEEKPE